MGLRLSNLFFFVIVSILHIATPSLPLDDTIIQRETSTSSSSSSSSSPPLDNLPHRFLTNQKIGVPMMSPLGHHIVHPSPNQHTHIHGNNAAIEHHKHHPPSTASLNLSSDFHLPPLPPAEPSRMYANVIPCLLNSPTLTEAQKNKIKVSKSMLYL